jgi:WD40 repeat protein/serine/threonine protein kinase
MMEGQGQPTIRQVDPAGETRHEGEDEQRLIRSDQQAAQQPAAPIQNWAKGQIILDTYEVKGKLGEGGFGAVYRAHHRGWNMDLAIKRALNLDVENKQDFIDEAQKWIDLGLHPHIVSCYYVRNIDGFPHTFAELAEGGSLDHWIQGDKFDLYEGGQEQALHRILDIAIQFAWGLGYAHQQGLVHQDVKPQNALMTPDGVLKVTDFGLAKAKGITSAGHEGELEADILVSGGSYTLAYRSPEQAQRKKLSIKTDIWSWAVSVLEMFNGEISWKAGDLAGYALESYLGRAGDEEDIPPMPVAVADLLRECFREDPQARPKDMLEIADLLMAVYQKVTGQPYRREMPKSADLRADSLNNKALSMLDLGKPREAEVYFEQALEADSQHVESTYNLGLLYWRSGRMADVDVLEKLGQIQQDRPGDVEVANALGWVCLESGRFGEALACFEQVDRLGGDSVSTDGLKLARPLAESGAGASLITFEGHTLYLTSAVFSPDERWVLSGSGDGKLKLWDTASGACLRTFDCHAWGVNSVAISPDVRWAISGSADKTLKLWDLSAGTCLRIFEGHTGHVEAVAFSPDGRQALSGSKDHTLKLWDLAGGACLRTFEGHTRAVTSVAISPDVRWALSGSQDKTLKLWDLVGGVCLHTFEGHLSRVSSVAFSPEGCQALSGSWDNTFKLWDLVGGICLRTYEGHTNWVTSVAFCLHGRRVLSGSRDETLKLWDLGTGVCLRTFEGHTGYVEAVAFSPDGCKAISGSWDKTLKLWDLAWVDENPVIAPLFYARGLKGSEAIKRERLHSAYLQQGHQLRVEQQIDKALVCLEHARGLQGYERAASTLTLSASLSAKTRIRGFREGWLARTFKGHTGNVYAVAFSPDGRWALTGSSDETVKLWDLAGGTCLRTFVGHTSSVSSVVFNPEGNRALSGSWDRTQKLWDLVGGKCLRTYKSHNGWVEDVAISSDGYWALSGSRPGSRVHTFKLWNLYGRICLRTFDANHVNSVAFSPGGQLALFGGYNGMLKLWDLAGYTCLRTFEGHTNYVLSVAFSPDECWALSGSGDHTLKLWDLHNGACLRTFEGHKHIVNSVTFSLDGRWGLSGSDDKTLKLWELSTGACLRTFEGHMNGVKSVAISPDGHQVLSGSEDQTLKLWNLSWEYEFPGWADWDEGARPYLEAFLTLHTPYAGELPQDRAPSEEELRLSLTRQGKPSWTEDDFQGLLKELGQRGYGWLLEEGVRKKLSEMAQERG